MFTNTLLKKFTPLHPHGAFADLNQLAKVSGLNINHFNSDEPLVLNASFKDSGDR